MSSVFDPTLTPRALPANPDRHNRRLAAVMAEVGVSNKGLAKRMRDAAIRDRGLPLGCTHTNIAKYLSGVNRPTARTLSVMVDVLSRLAGHRISPDEIGYSAITLADLEKARGQVLRPPRLTFAGVCIWCSTRGCDSRVCIARHIESRWHICPDCDGSGVKTNIDEACPCTFGLEQGHSVTEPDWVVA